MEIISKSADSCAEIFSKLPDRVNTPEINIHFSEHGEQYKAISKLSESIDFPDATINTIDGIRVDYENGWGLVRASNTTPCLVLRFEANNQEIMENIQEKFKAWLEHNQIPTTNL